MMEAAASIAGDPRFFVHSGPHSLQDVAEVAGGRVDGGGGVQSGPMLQGVAPLQTAGPGHVSFLDNRRYLDALLASKAGAVIVRADMATQVPAGCAAIVTPEPYLGWARVAALFHPAAPMRPGVHPAALVDASAHVDASCEIGAFAIVGAGAQIGRRCAIEPHAVIGAGVVIGPDCRIGSHVSINHALVGARVRLFPGVRIGQDGFGFAQSKEGFVSVPQLGRVILEDDVEVGSNSTIDRGSAQDTVIGAGSRLDNLVMIGHNVRLGRACVVVAQAGVSGSTVLEDFVVVGGQAGLVGHVHIGQAARLGAQAGIMADVPAGAEVVGSPAVPVRAFFRQVVALRRLAGERGRSVAKGEGDAS